ncbi:galactokinase [Carboxylicivirga sp. N1Y90]|uniref:galactokinase n=1 Tax=Carboxylicivirga fragile TaxID=3417571 RepID=UPI003D356D2D|nr:galactokinase [Marinilabiliaceae bacterium N1Y90]
MSKINELIAKINGGDNTPFKELYGTDTAVLKEQADRYIKYINEFKSIYGTDDLTLLSSPGRTEVGGNHTDHQLGRVLAGAVNLDNIAVAAPNNTNKVRITSVGFDPFEVDLGELEVTEFKLTPGNIVRTIAKEIKALGFEIAGFDAVIHGCVPEGSGLSSSASFEVLIGAIFSNLFNDGKLDPVDNAKIGQKAEHACKKFCGLMDQTACAVGGFITIDFADKANPIVKALDFDFAKTGYSLVITNTGGSHGGLDEEYNSLPGEMKAVAKELGHEVLRPLSMEDVVKGIPTIREKVGDRAILRAIHFQGDNARVVEQVAALEANKFQDFLGMVVESGYSSYMYNQNIFVGGEAKHQNVALALSMSELILKGKGAWRVHGGGFAGTIQAFVPNDLLDEYTSTLESVFGEGNCHKLFIRSKGSIKLEL